jgi:hypothetical protein
MKKIIKISALMLAVILTACGTSSGNPGLTVEASGGVYTQQVQPNESAIRLGTAIALKLRTPAGRTSADVAVRINGPEGWNQNQPLRFTYPAGSDWVIASEAAIVPINGAYSVTVAMSEAGGIINSSGRFEIKDSTTAGVLANPIVLEELSRSSVKANWADVPGSSSYYARVMNITDNVRVGRDVYTATSQAALPNDQEQIFDLDPSKAHDLLIYATSMDTVNPDPILPATLQVTENITALQLDLTRAKVRQLKSSLGLTVRY